MRLFKYSLFITTAAMLGWACGTSTTSPNPVVPPYVTSTAPIPSPMPSPAAPTLILTGPSGSVSAGTAIHFKIELSRQPLSLRIDFGDGTTLDLGAVTSADVTHVFPSAQMFNVSATATYEEGLMNKASIQVRLSA